MKYLEIVASLLIAVCFTAGAAAHETAARKIVLIGGTKSEGPARHDYPNGIRLLRDFLESSPDTKQIRDLSIAAFPDGWPTDDAAFCDMRVQQQSRFHFGASDVVAAGKNQVVGTRLVDEMAIKVLQVGVAGDVPAALHIVGLARVVQVLAARGAALPAGPPGLAAAAARLRPAQRPGSPARAGRWHQGGPGLQWR